MSVPENIFNLQTEIALMGQTQKRPSYRDVCLTGSQKQGLEKRKGQLGVSVLQKCPSYRGVH